MVAESHIASHVRDVGQHALNYASSGAATAKKAIIDHGPKAVTSAAAWTAENPAVAACAVAGTAGVALMAAPALASVPVLSAMGFTAGGVQAVSFNETGTLAATIHGGIGNVAAGSIFATAQSAAAGGAGLAVVNGAAQICGGVITAGVGGVAWLKSKL
ncbi:hypothetical protein A1O7_09172 [Cladophialophora yegresii CBS 114405]|uniref:Uncharacterized protein n=1 Tax=Cladophialophora yegresii CBS 114405 TaxID=1182544 RepID=W9VP11_9EURO|nr:uncharacterized protein A1O7_09172 [Cladophialophora yegresii CBS 114405]EXJ53836.1 hypothetical protein A1O7_09172 [Cladophialophora yegresii CBS 114405]